MASASVCLYYHARIERAKIWFVVGSLRNEDHVCFERALDKKMNTFEFFVPEGQQVRFLQLMNYFTTHGFVFGLEQRDNPFGA